MISLSNNGDTLVEVLLATVILSLVMAGAFAISNRATQIGQNSLERSQVSNLMQEQIEIVRAMRDNRTASWRRIVQVAPVASTADYSSCAPTTGNHPFYINFDESTYPAPSEPDDIRFNLALDSAITPFTRATDGNGNIADSTSDLFEVWLEPYRNGSDIEIHARACWDQLGGDIRGEANAVYQLQSF